MKDILSLRTGQCKYCLTDDTPFLFCGEPVWSDSVYCAEHHRLCYVGFGRPIDALETMIYGLDWSIVRARNQRPNTLPVDIELRGEE